MRKDEILANQKQIIDAGQEQKYNRSGLYEILVNGKLVYIGKSKNMLNRIANHMYEIEHNEKTKKYIYLRFLRQEGYSIQFDVFKYVDEGEDELGQQEAAAINQFHPLLNLQIPALDNYRSWRYNMESKNLNYRDLKKFLDS